MYMILMKLNTSILNFTTNTSTCRFFCIIILYLVCAKERQDTKCNDLTYNNKNKYVYI